MLRLQRPLVRILPLIFFGVLLLIRAFRPATFVFDEVHYIPASKAFGMLADDLNWVHPPFGKLVMALGWLILTKWTGLITEPYVFRVVTIGFGLWALWGVRGWMRALGFSEWAAQIAVWLTGFNFLWFVQSKTAMLDMYFLAFSVWGLLDVYLVCRDDVTRPGVKMKTPGRFWRGWIMLGLAMSAKWSALPYLLCALYFSRRRFVNAICGGALSIAAYALTFLPLSFLAKGAVSMTGLVAYHERMLRGMESINSANHPYLSKWWQWPTMIRPMWYMFESSAGREVCIWAGFNPVLAWVSLPFALFVGWKAVENVRGSNSRRPHRRKNNVQDYKRPAAVLALLYWLPLLFWAMVPRKLQMFYYFLPSGLWVGPIVVWAHEYFYHLEPEQVSPERALTRRSQVVRVSFGRLRQTRGWMLMGFALLCAVAFFYFLPIMDARALPAGHYQRFMWFRSWI